MDVKEFQKDFLEDIKATAATDGAGSSAAFVEIATNYLRNAEVLADFYHSFYQNTGKRNRKFRVDGYSLDEFDMSFTLLIADYTGDIDREKLTKTDAKSFFDKLCYFIDEVYGNNLSVQLEPSTAVSDLAELMISQKERIRKFRLILLTDGLMSNRINEIEARSLYNIPIECQIWDVERIFRVCFSDLGRQDVEIDFKVLTNGSGIPCLRANSLTTNEYRSFLCIIPGEILADIYNHYGSQLLEGNVRSFLSTKVAVNKKIRETILSMPQNFFAYNNGVSATARDLKIESTSSGDVITYVKDFQIINGGQTTASLFNAKVKDGADLSKIFVQMKLTEVDSDFDKANELIRNISRSSNSQNKVSDADFFATHPFHVRMEQISRKTFAPASGGSQHDTFWFYERARGQFNQAQMNLTKAQKAKFLLQNPKKQVITKTDLAKVRNSWAGLPQVVSKGAQANFIKFAEIIDEKWEKDHLQFNEKYFKETVALVKLFKETETLVSHQPWFSQGYRANIVTYTLALLNRMIGQQFDGMDLDLQLVWTKQTVPVQVLNELTKISKFVFDTITDPNRPTINVTQWCKREACWEKVKKCSLKLDDELKTVLIDKNEKRTAERDAKKDQKLISDMEAQETVLKLGAQYWQNLNVFISKKKINCSIEQRKALKYAMLVPTQIPSAYQSTRLLALLQIAKQNGFNGQGGD